MTETRERPKAEDRGMTVLEHLVELQRRLFRAAIVYVVCATLAFSFGYPWMKEFLTAPLAALDPETTNVFARHNPALRLIRPRMTSAATRDPIRLHQSTIMETFLVKFKMALLGGLILAAPFIFYQGWAFVAAGLLPRERRVILTHLPASIALFVAGIVFAYLTVMPVMTLYLLTVDPSIQPVLMYESYFTFMVVMLAVFGLAFQLPLVMGALARIGVTSADAFSKYRRHAIVGLFIAAAILTPSPDPLSQCLLAIPMIGLYELGIALARRLPRRRNAGDLSA